MRTISALLATLLLSTSACSGSSTTVAQSPSVVGSWLEEHQDPNSVSANAVIVTALLEFRPDGTYTFTGPLMQSSPTSGNVQVEVGAWTSTSSMVTLTPKEWSCRGPDPVSTFSYTVTQNQLVLTGAKGTQTLDANSGTTISATNEVNGCFDSAGHFTPTPLGPVSN